MTEHECRSRVSSTFGFPDGGLDDKTKLNGLTFGVVWRLCWDAYKSGIEEGRREKSDVGRTEEREG